MCPCLGSELIARKEKIRNVLDTKNAVNLNVYSRLLTESTGQDGTRLDHVNGPGQDLSLPAIFEMGHNRGSMKATGRDEMGYIAEFCLVLSC